MKKGLGILLSFLAITLVFCTKDRFPTPDVVVPPIDSLPNPTDTLIKLGFIKVNEFVAKGSTLVSDLGNTADWVELYNPSNTAITLEAGKWFVTDDSTEQDKFELPAITLSSKDFTLIFCDDSSKVSPNIHTNFALSSSGDFIGIYYKNAQDSIIRIDGRAFGTQATNVSEGRSPDGGALWTTFNNPTPNSTNN